MNEPKFKVCGLCQRRRRASSFDRRSRSGGRRTLKSYCRPCEKKYNRDRERARFQATPERRPQRAEAYRRAALKRQYGITVEEYDELLVAQGGCCAICSTTDPGRGHRWLPVDHCHETGAVRGLLCHRCNRTLGLLGDDVSLLSKAIEYLGRTP